VTARTDNQHQPLGRVVPGSCVAAKRGQSCGRWRAAANDDEHAYGEQRSDATTTTAPTRCRGLMVRVAANEQDCTRAHCSHDMKAHINLVANILSRAVHFIPLCPLLAGKSTQCTRPSCPMRIFRHNGYDGLISTRQRMTSFSARRRRKRLVPRFYCRPAAGAIPPT